METTTDTPTATNLHVAYLGNGAALHLVDDQGILCNRWGTVNGVWKAPRVIGSLATGATSTCRRCATLAAK